MIVICGIVGILLLLLSAKSIASCCKREYEHYQYEMAGFPAGRLETEMMKSQMYNSGNDIDRSFAHIHDGFSLVQ